MQSDDWKSNFIFNFFTDVDTHCLNCFIFFKNIRVEIALTLIEILDKYWHNFGQLTVVLYISDNVIDDDSERFEFQTSQTDKDWKSDDDEII